MKTGRQNVGQHRQIQDLGLGLRFVGEAEQIEVGIGDHDVFRLAADPAAEIDIAVGAARLFIIGIQANIRAALATGLAAAAGDVERHRDQISELQVLDVRAALDNFTGDLVPQHHAGRGAGPAAHHVLVGPADIGGEYLEDHAMGYLAARWCFEFRFGNGFDGDPARTFVNDTSIGHETLQ